MIYLFQWNEYTTNLKVKGFIMPFLCSKQEDFPTFSFIIFYYNYITIRTLEDHSGFRLQWIKNMASSSRNPNDWTWNYISWLPSPVTNKDQPFNSTLQCSQLANLQHGGKSTKSHLKHIPFPTDMEKKTNDCRVHLGSTDKDHQRLVRHLHHQSSTFDHLE